MHQLEIKEKLEELKKEKEEYMAYLEIENEIRAKAERDFKARVASSEIANFQQRVHFFFGFGNWNFK